MSRTVDIHAHAILPDCQPLMDGLMAREAIRGRTAASLLKLTG